MQVVLNIILFRPADFRALIFMERCVNVLLFNSNDLINTN